METQFIKLNMIPTGVNPCFHVSQYDIGRSLGFMIYNGSEVVDLDSYTCNIEATRSDGVAITVSVTTDDNVGTFETTATMTNKADKYKAQFVIVDGDSNRIASLPFDMNVVKAAMDENSEAIEEDASLYQQYTEAVQGAIAEANTDIQAEENARIAAVNAEATARQNADATLQTNINNEVTARANGDSALNQALANEASARTSADTTINARIDQIVAPSGEAPSAAEVADARVGWNGLVNPSLGDSIRNQITAVYRQMVTSTRTINLFNIDDLESGTINSSGNNTDNADFYRTSKKVAVTPSTKMTNNVAIWVVFYDSSEAFISRTSYSTVNTIISVPSNAAYVRFSIKVENYNTNIMVLNNGHMVEDFIPFNDFSLLSELDNENIEKYIDDIVSKTKTTNLFNAYDVEGGIIDTNGHDQTNSSWVRTITPIDVTGISNIISNAQFYYCFYDSNGELVSRAQMSTYTLVSVPSGSKTVRFIVQKSVYDAYKDSLMVLSINYIPLYQIPYYNKQLDSRIGIDTQFNDKIETYFKRTRGLNLFDINDITAGGITSEGLESSVSSGYKTVHPVPVDGEYIICNFSGWVACYDSEGSFISRYNFTYSVPYALPTGTVAVRFMFSDVRDDIIVVNDSSLPDEFKPFEYIRFSDRVSNEKKKDVFGRQFLIYRFGGEGNDWCFVRTPSNYNPYRKKPYPFVICNHGNGTTMDGSKVTANWTKHTMYLNPDNPDFDSDYDMVATTEPELQYSNAVIEKFLSEGYIVCGCENYADGLYGNENCRRACVDFYNHMQKAYNVPDYCYMIGASNGAQTTINAAYLLGSRIRAIVLQYGLTCLINHYYEKPSHQAPIRAAYGITNNSPSEEELIQATLTHDVLHTNIIDGKIAGYFPACALYYSDGDSMTAPINNSIPLANLLTASSKIVETHECTGGHGSPSQFDPNGFFEFISTH